MQTNHGTDGFLSQLRPPNIQVSIFLKKIKPVMLFHVSLLSGFFPVPARGDPDAGLILDSRNKHNSEAYKNLS